MKPIHAGSIAELVARPARSGATRMRGAITSNELSPRQMELLLWTALALSDKEIAEKMQVSVDCVKAVGLTVRNKIGADNRVGMALYVFRAGLLPVAEKLLER
jgi:DNA-binding CsgD family transcriptional regulator